MIPILGRPYLHYQLEYLKRQGIGEALLLVGHLGEQIVDYFGSGKSLGMRLEYSREKELLGTGGALKLAGGKIHDDFVVIYGDSFLPLDYADFESSFRGAGREGMIAVYKDGKGDTGVKPNVGVSAEMLVSGYDKQRCSPELDYVEAGVLAFKKGVLGRIPPGKAVSLENDIYPRLIGEGELAAYPCGRRFFDIGTEQRIRDMEAWLQNDYLKNTVQG